MHSLRLCLLLMLLIAGTGALADQVRVMLPDQSIRDFEGVEVQTLQRDGSGRGMLMVKMADGQVHPVELDRVQAISFGSAGEGRAFNLVVETADGQRPFLNSTLLHYASGVFAAHPVGESEAAAIPQSNLVSFISGAAAAEQPTNPDDLFGEESGMASDTGADEESGDFGADSADGLPGGGGGRFGGRPDDPKAALDAMFAEMRANGVSPGLLMTFTVLFFLYLALVVFTSTWLMVHAFTKGNVGWGLGIIAATILGFVLCCCSLAFMGICTLSKSYYMRQYETPYRPFIYGVVTTETFIYVALSVMQWFLR